MTVLSARNIGKAFRSYRSEWSRILRWFGLSCKPAEESWILRNISFDISSGESIGVIGPNGVGKSTLLKMIVGTMKPSEGKIVTNGRIAAILELGMGFILERTGRENVYHTAGLMGFTRNEIDEKIADIESFAAIGEYFDQPLRIYSSGMQMRVAFAVASAWGPDILIIDEALSVGDIYFQQKCLTKIQEIIAKGTSLILVSHDTHTIREFTQQAIFLNHDKYYFDNTEIILELYERILLEQSKKESATKLSISKSLSSSGYQDDIENEDQTNVLIDDGTVQCVSFKSLGRDGESNRKFVYGSTIVIDIFFELKTNVDDPVIGIMIKDRLGRDVFCCDTDTYFGILLDSFSDTLRLRFEFTNILVEGIYFISLSLAQKNPKGIESFEHMYFAHRISHFYSVKVNKENSFRGIVDLKPVIDPSPLLDRKGVLL